MLLAGDTRSRRACRHTRRTGRRRLPRAKPPSLKRCGCSPSSAVLRPSLSGAPVWQRRGSGRTNLGVTAVLRSGRPSGRRAGRRCWHTFHGAVWCKTTRMDGPSHKRAGQTVGLARIELATSALSVLLAPPFGAAMPNEYSRSPAALLSTVTPGMASVGVILGAHGGAVGAQAAQSPVVGIGPTPLVAPTHRACRA
jgi:hypothetical protein